MSVGLAVAGAAIFLLLGLAHMVFTLQSTPEGGPMMPTDPAVVSAMSETGGLGMAPELRSSLFRAWIGFNLSHSLGLIVIASIIIYHALDDLGAALAEPWFVAVTLLVPVVYLGLAQLYWFGQPRDAIGMATVLLWVGLLVERL